jgi:hypothetical protein
LSKDRREYDIREGKPSSAEELAAGQRRPSGSLVPLVTVVGFGSAAALVVVACAGLPGILVLLALAGVAAFIGLQYLIWGWWLGNRIRQEEQAEEAGD